MRLALAAATALALSACGGEPAKPADPAPEAAATAPAAPAMDDMMKAADSADDANVAETPDGYMFHTDTTKTEKVHLPAGNWTATAADAAQIQVLGASDVAMPDGASHHIVDVKPLTRDVIAKVKFERRDTADATAPVVETRTVMFMIH